MHAICVQRHGADANLRTKLVHGVYVLPDTRIRRATLIPLDQRIEQKRGKSHRSGVVPKGSQQQGRELERVRVLGAELVDRVQELHDEQAGLRPLQSYMAECNEPVKRGASDKNVTCGGPRTKRNTSARCERCGTRTPLPRRAVMSAMLISARVANGCPMAIHSRTTSARNPARVRAYRSSSSCARETSCQVSS